MREECEVDYPHSRYQLLEADIFYHECQLDSDLPDTLWIPNRAFQCVSEYRSLCVGVLCMHAQTHMNLLYQQVYFPGLLQNIGLQANKKVCPAITQT